MISSKDCLDVIADGAVASPFTADGRLIPVVILDANQDGRLSNLISIHDDFSFGDVESTWAFKRLSKKSVYLILFFEKPVELKVAVRFDVSSQSNLVDGIIQSRAVYIQSGEKGDSLRDSFDAPKILVEIPARTTFNEWESILAKNIAKKLKKEGVSRREMKAAVNDYVSTSRSVWVRRLGGYMKSH